MIVTRPDQGMEQNGAQDLSFSKCSVKPVVWKTRCNYGQFYPVSSEDFCAQKLTLKFMHIYADDQGTF